MPTLRISHRCQHCGKEFESKRVVDRYCTAPCRDAAHQAGVARGVLTTVDTEPPGNKAIRWRRANNGHIVAEVHSPDGSTKYISKMRYVVEQSLGRPLDPWDEIVIHKNGKRHDNRLINLQVLTRDEHEKLTRTYRWKTIVGRAAKMRVQATKHRKQLKARKRRKLQTATTNQEFLALNS